MQQVPLQVEIAIESAWASPKAGMTVWELKRHLEHLGHKIVEIDLVNKRVRVK